ncbi:MAG: hypothetical protein KDB88_06270 [Flavobacteriales bacterium]|nr:hypothetical protein [Flavobacteriales bacterium]
MPRLLLKLALLVVALVIAIAILRASLPYGWGNPYVVHKLEQLSERDIKPRQLIIGSSRAYRSVIPDLLDSLMGAPTGTTYNLAGPGISAGQCFYLADHVLADTALSGGLRTLVFELQDHAPITGNLGTNVRETYWHGVRHWWMTCAAVIQSNRKWTTKTILLRDHSLALLRASLGLGLYSGVRELFMPSRTRQELIGARNDGFRDLEDESGSSDEREVHSGLRERHQEWFANTALRSKVMNNARSSRTDTLARPGSADVDRLHDLIERCEARGIRFIAWLPPLSNSAYAHALFRTVPVDHRVDLHDPYRFPELYTIEHAFDRGHLDRSGAELLTRYLAQELIDP